MDPVQVVRGIDKGIYVIDHQGRRRPVLNMEIFNLYRHDLGWDLKQLQSVDPAQYEFGAYIPRRYTFLDQLEIPKDITKSKMRELMVSQVTGHGVEFGAGARPLPVPMGVSVAYAEPYFNDDQMHRMFGATDNWVRPSLAAAFDNQTGIEPDSLDFVLAAHVIEHTKNPIGAIQQSWRNLRPGGQLVMMVPDKRYTFDRGRPFTSLEHLLQDFENPSDERDFHHYVEHERLIAGNLVNPEVEARRLAEAGRDMHFHVWNIETFYYMLRHIVSRGIAPFSEMRMYPRLDVPANSEFYVILTK